jgi:hypothetical protein
VLLPDGAPKPKLKQGGAVTRELNVIENTASTQDDSADAITLADGSTLELPRPRC